MLITANLSLILKATALLLAFLNTVLISRVIGPNGRGELALVLSFSTMLVPFLELGVRQSLTYYLGKKQDTEKYLIAASQILLISVFLGFIVTIIFFSNYNSVLVGTFLGKFWVFLLVTFTISLSYVQGLKLGFGQLIGFSVWNVVHHLLLFLLLLFSYLYEPEISSKHVLIFYVFSYFPSFIYLAYKLMPYSIKTIKISNCHIDLLKKGGVYAFVFFSHNTKLSSRRFFC